MMGTDLNSKGVATNKGAAAVRDFTVLQQAGKSYQSFFLYLEWKIIFTIKFAFTFHIRVMYGAIRDKYKFKYYTQLK